MSLNLAEETDAGEGRAAASVDYEFLAMAWESKASFLGEDALKSSDPATQGALDAFLRDGYDGLRRTLGAGVQRVIERVRRGGDYHPKTLVSPESAARGLDESAPVLGDLLGKAFEEMGHRADGSRTPIATPWPALNSILGGGFWPGLHVLTGTTGSGKTQLALQVALRAAAEDVPVLYVALELSRTELVARLAALAASEFPGAGRAPKWSDLYLGKDPGALERLGGDVRAFLAALPIRIEEAAAGEWVAGRNLSERARAMREAHSGRTPLIVVDYLQIVGAENVRQDLRGCIRSAALAARNVAREGAAVLLLSSVSRENAKLLGPGEDGVRPDADPSILVGLGKESGEIEFSADSVLALSREEYREGGTPMHLAAAKVRAGRPGWVSISFDGSRFSGGQPVKEYR